MSGEKYVTCEGGLLAFKSRCEKVNIHLQYTGLQFVIVFKLVLKQKLPLLACLIINSICEKCVFLNLW